MRNNSDCNLFTNLAGETNSVSQSVSHLLAIYILLHSNNNDQDDSWYRGYTMLIISMMWQRENDTINFYIVRAVDTLFTIILSVCWYKATFQKQALHWISAKAKQSVSSLRIFFFIIERRKNNNNSVFTSWIELRDAKE